MCNNRVSVYVESSRELEPVEITVDCGDIVNTGHTSSAVLCPTCKEKAVKDYPKGWRYYPGDVCEHGTYIGGDRDCACHYCEEEG